MSTKSSATKCHPYQIGTVLSFEGRWHKSIDIVIGITYEDVFIITWSALTNNDCYMTKFDRDDYGRKKNYSVIKK